MFLVSLAEVAWVTEVVRSPMPRSMGGGYNFTKNGVMNISSGLAITIGYEGSMGQPERARHGHHGGLHGHLHGRANYRPVSGQKTPQIDLGFDFF